MRQGDREGEGERGTKLSVTGDHQNSLGAWGPSGLPVLNAWQHHDGHWWLRGVRLSPELGLGCPQSSVLGGQEPGEGPLGPHLRVRVKLQEPSRPDLLALWGAEQRGKVMVWGKGSMGPRVVASP